MKCIRGNQANVLCLSSECSKSPLICTNLKCNCFKDHNIQVHRNVSVHQVMDKVNNRIKLIANMKVILKSCNELMNTIKVQTNKIEAFIQQNCLSTSQYQKEQQFQQINKNIPVEQILRIAQDDVRIRINEVNLSHIPKILQYTKQHLQGIWKVIEINPSPRQLFARFNRKIQGNKNVQNIYLNNVNIVPLPKTFDITKLTGIRLFIIDLKTIRLLSYFCKSLRRLQIYQQNTVSDKHAFQIANLLRSVVHLNLNSQNILPISLLKISKNMKLKSCTIFTKNITQQIKHKFKRLCKTCSRLSL